MLEKSQQYNDMVSRLRRECNEQVSISCQCSSKLRKPSALLRTSTSFATCPMHSPSGSPFSSLFRMRKIPPLIFFEDFPAYSSILLRTCSPSLVSVYTRVRPSMRGVRRNFCSTSNRFSPSTQANFCRLVKKLVRRTTLFECLECYSFTHSLHAKRLFSDYLHSFSKQAN